MPDAVWSRDLTVGSSTGGGYLVGTEVAGFIEVLRNRGLLMSGLLGATMMTGLKQNETLAGEAATVTTHGRAQRRVSIGDSHAFAQLVGPVPEDDQRQHRTEPALRLMSAGVAESLVMRDIYAGFAIELDTAAINRQRREW